MSNRVLWVLIILWFILSWILFYIYFFVYYMWNITVKSNIGDYNITLYNKKLIKTKHYDCLNKICNLKDISPFDYFLKLTKSWYIDKNIDIKVQKNEKINLNVTFDKKTILNEIKIEAKNLGILNVKLTNQEKISLLRKKNNSYFYTKSDNQVFSFKKEWNYLKLYKDNLELWTFEKVKKEDIKISEVLWDSDYVFIELAKKKYLYSIVIKKKYPVNLNININYIKKWQDNTQFIFITTKWAFVYNKFSLNLEYFDFFRDFIYYKSWYIGIINKNDTRRLNNLWLENITKNLIIYYNTDSKEKKILYKTNIDILKIYKKWADIMFTSSDNKEYKLENY